MNENTNISPMLQMTINKMTGDMSFVGIFYIIIGAIYCLSIIGAIIGIPFIICGLRLRESSDSFKNYIATEDENMLERALERQGKFFFIQKILIIIGLVLMVLYIIGIIVFGSIIFSDMNSNFDYSLVQIIQNTSV